MKWSKQYLGIDSPNDHILLLCKIEQKTNTKNRDLKRGERNGEAIFQKHHKQCCKYQELQEVSTLDVIWKWKTQKVCNMQKYMHSAIWNQIPSHLVAKQHSIVQQLQIMLIVHIIYCTV